MIKLTRHRGTDAAAYPDDPETLYLDPNRIEAVFLATYRFFGRRSKTEYVYTTVVTHSGDSHRVTETPKEIFDIIESKVRYQ